MEFRLIYEGKLHPAANRPRAKEIHEIRKNFHPQLRQLWRVNPSLMQLAERSSYPVLGDLARAAGTDPAMDPTPRTKEDRIKLGLAAIGKKWRKANYDLIPLVTEGMALRCTLSILLLRPEGKKYSFTQGDIDGQLKTLFDSLRLPKHEDETARCAPTPDDSPLYCLLEDDKLVTEVKVTTDQLLLLPHQREVNANDAFVVVHVRLNHRNPRFADNYFG